MSYLMVEQLVNAEVINTKLKFSKPALISNIRIGVYKKGSPNGFLKVDFKYDGTIVATGIVQMSDLIAEVGSTYFYGYVNLTLDNPFKVSPKGASLELDLEISINSHTNSDSNYLSLERNPSPSTEVFGDVVPTSIVGQDIWLNPFAIEVYSY